MPAQTMAGSTVGEDSMPLDNSDMGTSTLIPEAIRTFDFPEAYVLGPSDRIRVDIFNVPEFSGPENGVHEVLVDGTVTIPMIGIVDVQGLTLEQTQQILTAKYSALLTRPPQLTVTLLSSRPLRIAVAGEVNRPGTYAAELTTQPESGSPTAGRLWPTLTQVIQQAGGITQQANIQSVEIRRPQRNGPDAVMVANLWDLIRNGDINQDVRLRDGDTVVVPTAQAPSPAELGELSTANFSPSEIPVQVVGEVVQPGRVSVPTNTTLNQAILAAGGFKNSRASTSSVELVRLNLDGSVERRTLKVDLSVPANNENNPVLRPNDVVMVNRNAVATAGDALGVFLNPLTAVTAVLRLLGL
ncbi:MAG TPA: SLBB domain-containing protein [Leptolyngbyaceae cyanobacterium]